MILEVYVGVFFFTLAFVSFCLYSKTNHSYEYLIKNFSKKILSEYIDSYFYDKKITKKLKSKKQLVRFIIQTTENLHNVKECNICYETTDYIRVHKCKICTMMVCMNCLNRWTVPVKCPQCSYIWYFQEITNNVLYTISYDNWCLFVWTCSIIIMFVIFVLLFCSFFLT